MGVVESAPFFTIQGIWGWLRLWGDETQGVCCRQGGGLASPGWGDVPVGSGEPWHPSPYFLGSSDSRFSKAAVDERKKPGRKPGSHSNPALLETPKAEGPFPSGQGLEPGRAPWVQWTLPSS